MRTPTIEELSGFTSAYTRNIGSKPLVEAGVLGTGGAFVGYHGMNVVVPVLLKALMVGKSEAQRNQILEDYKTDGTLQYVKNLGAGLGLAAGVGYAVQKHMDWGSGRKGAWESMKDPKYWSTSRGKFRLNEMKETRKRNDLKAGIEKTKGYSSGRTKLGMLEDQPEKTAALNAWQDPLFNSERIPVSYSLNLINADPFLTLGEKEITGRVLEGAEGGDSGLVSGRDVARSAIQAGIGGGIGILLGKAVGALLSLPSPVTRRLSVAGAIAGALTNTGLFSEIRK